MRFTSRGLCLCSSTGYSSEKLASFDGVIMETNFFKRYLIILIPVVGLLIVGLFLLSYGNDPAREPVPVLIVHGLLMTAGLWLGCMTIVSWLWRKFPWEQAPWKHLLLEVTLILGYTVLFSGSVYLLEVRFLDFKKPENLGMEILLTILITLFITSIHESIFFYMQWKYNFSKSVRLERDNIEARYETLRAQINPHFLFNSLNSLSVIAGDNSEAVEYIQDLSELLRYSFRSGEKELVVLRDETDILRRYANLQQKRFGSNLSIIIDVPEKCMELTLPPLVLQMLVENCIKHNVISADKPLNIEVRADSESITVSNNLQRKQDGKSTGTGLYNIRGRYRFLTSRELVIRDDSNIFSVTLPLLRLEL
jgi:hypothetical protein